MQKVRYLKHQDQRICEALQFAENKASLLLSMNYCTNTLEPRYNTPRYNAISVTTLFILGSQMIVKKITVGLGRHKKFIYFCPYYILTKIFSLSDKKQNIR